MYMCYFCCREWIWESRFDVIAPSRPVSLIQPQFKYRYPSYGIGTVRAVTDKILDRGSLRDAQSVHDNPAPIV